LRAARVKDSVKGRTNDEVEGPVCSQGGRLKFLLGIFKGFYNTQSVKVNRSLALALAWRKKIKSEHA
jgi:hypothetical protein